MSARHPQTELLARAGRLLLEYNASTGEIHQALERTSEAVAGEACRIWVSYRGVSVSFDGEPPSFAPVRELRYNTALQARVHAILDRVSGGGLDAAAALSELESAEAGTPRHPVLIALRETVRRFAIPVKPFLNLLAAFEQDQRVTRYETFDDLLGYCRNSANPVGHVVLYLYDSFTPERAAVPAVFQTMALEIPILTMLPIPFIRIEETTIDFNAKINSVEETKTDDTFKFNASTDAKVQYPPLFSVATVNLKVSTSYQKNTQTGTKVQNGPNQP